MGEDTGKEEVHKIDQGTRRVDWKIKDRSGISLRNGNIYYPDLCNKLSHEDTWSIYSGMNSESTKEKEAAKRSILAAALANEMSKNPQNNRYTIFGDQMETFCI